MAKSMASGSRRSSPSRAGTARSKASTKRSGTRSKVATLNRMSIQGNATSYLASSPVGLLWAASQPVASVTRHGRGSLSTVSRPDSLQLDVQIEDCEDPFNLSRGSVKRHSAGLGVEMQVEDTFPALSSEALKRHSSVGNTPFVVQTALALRD
eukprot:UN23368